MRSDQVPGIEMLGCPSGLEPSADSINQDHSDIIDPTPYISRRDGTYTLELAVFGAKCAGCISKIETAMIALDGIDNARLNLSTGRLSLKWHSTILAPIEITRTLHDIGYRAAPFDPAAGESDHDAEGRRLLRALGVAGFATANVMLLSVSVWAGGGEMGEGARGLMHWASAIIAVPAALYAGRPFFASAWNALKNRQANMDVPISLAVVLALSLSVYEFFAGGEHAYFDAAVMLLFFLLIGRYLDHRLRWRARAAARDLMSMQTITSRRIRNDDTIESVAVRDIKVGDRLLLSPGDKAPVDGMIINGSSYADVSLVTGESAPRKLSINDQIHAGVINKSDQLTMRATASVENSLIADLMRLIEAGEQSRSRYIRLADRAAALYVPVVHSLAFLTLTGWLIAGGGVRLAIMNAVAVLIITCPCALGLAAPAVQVVATGRLFKSGILVKSGDALERLAEATKIVFDKTGTLTIGRPQLKNRSALPADSLDIAASLARISRHPLSRAIVDASGAGTIAADAVEFAGLGIEASINGQRARLGSAEWVGATKSDDTKLESWLKIGNTDPVRLIFEDMPHKDAASVIAALKNDGLSVELLSGDREDVVRQTAEQLQVSDYSASVSPQDKSAKLQELTDSGFKVAMVGDGLNDTPSLALAHVSLSPGSAADASQAAADFVYLSEGVGPIVEAVTVSRKARKRVLENFAFAAFYNACAIPLAVFGFVTPLIAALAMSGSSMIVTLNALRLSKGPAPNDNSFKIRLGD
ncbi:MAG: heavy metal translocating P-type ATPase [Pseudomonadota bacterium]